MLRYVVVGMNCKAEKQVRSDAILIQLEHNAYKDCKLEALIQHGCFCERY